METAMKTEVNAMLKQTLHAMGPAVVRCPRPVDRGDKECDHVWDADPNAPSLDAAPTSSTAAENIAMRLRCTGCGGSATMPPETIDFLQTLIASKAMPDGTITDAQTNLLMEKYQAMQQMSGQILVDFANT